MLPPTERSREDRSYARTSQTQPSAASGDGRGPLDGAPAPQPLGRGGTRAWRKWVVRLGILVAVLVAVAAVRWRVQRPAEVSLIQPTVTTITETIASSGRVHGVIETMVGAQVAGIVERLLADEGDRVKAGEWLAVLKRDVAEARVAQAEQAVHTARAQLTEVERRPLASEVEAALEQVRQAQAQLAQQRAALQQAQQSVARARAELQQLQAELELAATRLERFSALLERNYIARADYDEVRTQFRVAEQRVAAAQQAVDVAQSNVRAAQAGVQAGQANVRALEARLRTVQTGATPEEIEVARQRVAEVEQALRVARRQLEETVVTAPFDGIITAINAEPGQPVGTQGVVRLVSTGLEVRVDVDEGYLADLAVGQDAVISSSAFREDTFRGRVSEIGAAVDVARGTVLVRVAPLQPPGWLRPGQTVNVNIITHEAVPRLLVPPEAVSRSGEQTVVFVVENGRALEKVVITRPPTGQGVPVLAGLHAEDRVIANTRGITAGERVQVRG
jgi:HlyD family secretion protein